MKFLAGILFLLILFTPGVFRVSGNLSPPPITDIFRHVGQLTGVDHRLLRAIATVESNLDPWAIGDKGKSLGLMQIHSSTRKQFKVPHHSLLFDAEINVRIGALHLKRLIDRYGVHGAIHAYNVGESKYRIGVRVKSYYRKVMRAWRAK
ncbi:MAG: lytic transglycosylase domain-containing protein [Thermoplasmata archaeon]|nr:lytic transglycosylase domain-containing protein [Thermoplasmata archaeon]